MFEFRPSNVYLTLEDLCAQKVAQEIQRDRDARGPESLADS